MSRNRRSTPDSPVGEDLTASKRGESHQLLCSRRASDAVRARAYALNKAIYTVLDEAIKRGLAVMPDPYREQPITNTSSAASSRHGAQGEPATAVGVVAHETPAAGCTTDEETP